MHNTCRLWHQGRNRKHALDAQDKGNAVKGISARPERAVETAKRKDTKQQTGQQSDETWHSKGARAPNPMVAPSNPHPALTLSCPKGLLHDKLATPPKACGTAAAAQPLRHNPNHNSNPGTPTNRLKGSDLANMHAHQLLATPACRY